MVVVVDQTQDIEGSKRTTRIRTELVCGSSAARYVTTGTACNSCRGQRLGFILESTPKSCHREDGLTFRPSIWFLRSMRFSRLLAGKRNGTEIARVHACTKRTSFSLKASFCGSEGCRCAGVNDGSGRLIRKSRGLARKSVAQWDNPSRPGCLGFGR